MAEKKEMPAIKSRPMVIIYEIPIARVKKFWDGLSEGKLYTTKCKKCGKIYYPPQSDCPKCLASEIEWIELSYEGIIETYTEAHLRPQGFTHYEKPYIIAIAKLPEGVKIMGWLEAEPGSIKVGSRVRIEPRIQSDGFPTIIFKHIT